MCSARCAASDHGREICTLSVLVITFPIISGRVHNVDGIQLRLVPLPGARVELHQSFLRATMHSDPLSQGQKQVPTRLEAALSASYEAAKDVPRKQAGVSAGAPQACTDVPRKQALSPRWRRVRAIV